MNPLQMRLASLRRRMLLVNFWRGSCTLFAVIIGILLVEGLLDRLMHLPAAIRGLFLVGTLATFGTVFVRYLYLPLTKRLDDLSLALRIEEVYPELNDNLASAVQFLEEPEENLPGSKVMRQHAVEHALKRADHCDFSNIIDRRGVFVRPLAALVVGLLAAHFLYHHEAQAAKAAMRLIDPFGGHSWTQIDVEAVPPCIAQGQRFTIRGQLSGIIPDKARLELDGNLLQTDKAIVIKRDADLNSATFEMPLDMSTRAGKLRFRVVANDGTYPADGGWTGWIEVQAPPQLVQMSQQIELEYPAYTDLRSPEKLSPGLCQVDAVAGTLIRWSGNVDRPIDEAWIEHGNTRIACQIDSSRKSLSALFAPPATTAAAVIRFKDKLGLTNSMDDKIDLNIFADPPPSIHLKQPEWRRKFGKRLVDAQITLEVGASDKTYGLRSVYLEYRRKSKDGAKWADAEWQHIPIVHADLIGLFAMLGQDFRGLALPMHVRPQHLELTLPWELNRRFAEGEIVSFRVGADDFNGSATTSWELEFIIVNERELRQNLNSAFDQTQHQVLNLLQIQKEAHRLVKEIQEAQAVSRNIQLIIAATGGVAALDSRLDPQNMRDKLSAASRKQADIKELIRAVPDGLTKQLVDLEEEMRENRLPHSALQNNVKYVRKKLNSLVRVDPATKQLDGLLPQVENSLARSLKQFALPEPKPEEEEGEGEKGRKEEREKGREGEGEKGRKGEREKGREGEGEKGRKGEGENGKGKDALNLLANPPEDWQFVHAVQDAPAKKDAPIKKDVAPPKKEKAVVPPRKDDGDPLEDARIGQEKALKTLDELAQFLAPWANEQDVKNSITALHAQQTRLKVDTEDLLPIKPPPRPLLDQRAEQQERLAIDADNLLKLIEQLQGTAAMGTSTLGLLAAPLGEGPLLAVSAAFARKAEGPDVKFAELARIAEEANLPKEMRDISLQLRNPKEPNLFENVQKQEGILKNLERMLAALDEKSREEELDILSKPRKKAQQDLDKLRHDMARLDEKIKEAGNDPGKLKQLADEQKRLEERARKLSDELARLQADRASEDLKQAADAMADAEARMRKGNEPGDDLQEQIQKNLNQAKANLEQAQEELAREKLALTVDRIKGIKGREDGAVGKSAEIHKKLLEQNRWSKDLKSTLKKSGETQELLAKETASLKGKLAQSPIFEHILNNARNSMDKAAAAIKKRHSNELPYDPLDKDQLDDENNQQEQIVKLQKQAADRLQYLIDALQPDLPDKNAKPKNPGGDPGKIGGDPQQKPRPSRDGITYANEIKALEKEVAEVQQRIKEFHKRVGANKMTPEQRQELDALIAENRILLLFNELHKEKKGDEP